MTGTGACLPRVNEQGVQPMESRNTEFKVVRLLQPALCVTCRFAAIVTAEMVDGASRMMLHCKRRDCDNWTDQVGEEIPIAMQEGR